VPGPVVRPLPAAFLAVTTALAAVSVPLLLGHELLTNTLLYPANAVVLSLCGALISSRWPRSSLGWLLSVMGVVAAFGEAAQGYGYRVDYPAASPVQWMANWISALDVGAYAIMLAMFPAARSLTVRWRGVVWAAGLATALLTVGTAFGHVADSEFESGRNPYAVGHLWFGMVYAAGQVLVLAVLLASIASLVVRFRRSAGVERQQLKWVAYVVTALAVIAPFAIFFYFDSVVVQIAIAFVVTAVPVAICVAILRYRLYDIDVIINRTVVYGALSLLLAGGYIGVTLALGAVLGSRHSPWVTAGATLTAAAAFRPLRGRIQDAVDRRFRRSRYDALGRVDAFLEDLRAGRAAPELLDVLLRDVLGCRDLEVCYFLADQDAYIDARGREVAIDAEDDQVRNRVERAGVLLAVVRHAEVAGSPSATADGILLKEVLGRAGLAIEIARLQAEVHHQLAEVEASRARIITAGYEERRRLERDLHDGAQQRLVSIGLALRHAQHELGASPVTDIIEAAVAEIAGAISDLRALAHGVRPALLDSGLAVALHELASRSPLPVEVKASVGRFAADVEATAYFVVCEAVTNAVKHSHATAVALHAERRDGHLVVTVRDDGVGGARTAGGSGLRGLSDRVEAHGGQIRLDSPPGRGTILIAELPCAS